MLIKKIFSFVMCFFGVVGCSLPNNGGYESNLTVSTLDDDELSVGSSSFQTNSLDNSPKEQTNSTSQSCNERSSSKAPDNNSSNVSLSSEWDLCVDMQDGCIYDDFLFMFDSTASCSIYNLLDKTLIASIDLPDYNGWIPHSNSVFFGKKYVDSDPFPLLYTNVYNNYGVSESALGMCFVYRISYNSCFEFELVQIIKVGFVNDMLTWYNNSYNSDPYGNFFINDNDLWIYVGISGSSITRFFKTKLPVVNLDCEGIDTKIIVLEDILSSFDTIYFHFLQGNTVFLNKLLSIEGSGQDDAPGFLRIVELETAYVQSINLNQLFNGKFEPEFIDIYGEYLVIGFYYWKVYFLPISYFGL